MICNDQCLGGSATGARLLLVRMTRRNIPQRSPPQYSRVLRRKRPLPQPLLMLALAIQQIVRRRWNAMASAPLRRHETQTNLPRSITLVYICLSPPSWRSVCSPARQRRTHRVLHVHTRLLHRSSRRADRPSHSARHRPRRHLRCRRHALTPPHRAQRLREQRCQRGAELPSHAVRIACHTR